MNGFARLRFELINQHQRQILSFGLRVVTILAPAPYISPQDGVCLDAQIEYHYYRVMGVLRVDLRSRKGTALSIVWPEVAK
eukprot:scaffold68552_cov97-Cyclotella_meneghiniana.AAC.3